MNSILTHCIRQSIQSNPEAAAQEVPAILDYYLTDNTRLNQIYLAAKRLLLHPDKFGMDMLRRAVADAEKPFIQLWDEEIKP